MSDIQPNAKCPCGSGKKYKKCCYLSQFSGSTPEMTLADAEAEVARMSPEEIQRLNSEFETLLARFVAVNNDPTNPDHVEFKKFLREEGIAVISLTDGGIEIERMKVFEQRDFRKRLAAS